MGRGYTRAASSNKEGQRMQDRRDRATLLISSAPIAAIEWALRRTLFSLGLHLLPGPAADASSFAPPDWPRPWKEGGDFAKKEGPTLEEEARLAESIFVRAERAGPDVRIQVGTPFVPSAWPRAAVDSGLWRWRISAAWRWAQTGHINLLEQMAYLATIKGRSRRVDSIRSKFAHLLDSQVTLAINVKCRTSSLLLQRPLRRGNALFLAAHMYPCLGYVLSQDNPSDTPTRWEDSDDENSEE
jgi:hypothetical protein